MLLMTFAGSVHNPKIMLRMLVKVLCGDPIVTRRRLPRESSVTFKDLTRGASDLDVRTVTLEIVTSLRYLLPITVGIVTVITPMRPAVLSCSHETFCIDGEVGSLSNESVSETFAVGQCRAAFLCGASSFARYARWGRPYFQQFFGAMPAESGLIVTGSLLKPHRIKDLGGCGYHKASFWRCHLMSELENGFSYGGPRVRIHFPPAASLLRTGLSGARYRGRWV